MMALMSAASFSERNPSFCCSLGAPVDASISSSPGFEIGVPFLMPNWAWMGCNRYEKERNIEDRRMIENDDLMMLDGAE